MAGCFITFTLPEQHVPERGAWRLFPVKYPVVAAVVIDQGWLVQCERTGDEQQTVTKKL